MGLCFICGESKVQGEFKNIPNFTKYKKRSVSWCRDCQKLFLEMKRNKEMKNKILHGEKKFDVSFQ